MSSLSIIVLLMIRRAIYDILLYCNIRVDSLGHIFNYIHGSTNSISKVFAVYLHELRLSQLSLAALDGLSENSAAIVILIAVAERGLVLLHQVWLLLLTEGSSTVHMLGLMALLLILFQYMLFILYYDCSDLGGIVTVLMLILIVSGSNRGYSVMICLIGKVRSLISHAGSSVSRSVAHVRILLTMHHVVVAWITTIESTHVVLLVLILFIKTKALCILISQFELGLIRAMLPHVFPNELSLAKIFFRSYQISLCLLYTAEAVSI